jgi:flagellar biosynthesis protein FlhG
LDFCESLALNTKAKIITISSGNSGVGKTCTAVNLSVLLAQRGHKVCLFDADAELENVNVMLNLLPDFTLQDVLSGEKTLNDITIRSSGLDIIPGATGLTSFISLTKDQQLRLQKSMQQLQAEYDYLIIDNTAGISNSVRYYNKISDFAIIVITPDPASLSATFSLIRVLQKRGSPEKYQIMVNNVSDEVYAKRVFNRFFTPVEKHIGCRINYLGCVMSDEKIPESICLQNPVVLEYPTSASAFSFSQLARRLILIPRPVATNNAQRTEQKSDFSENAVNKTQLTEQATSQRISPEQLKEKMISNINNDQIEEHKIKEMVLQVNNAYLKRFGHYVVDLPYVIHDALKMEHLSEQTLRNLLMTLHSVYQDQYKPAEIADSSATSVTQQSVNQLITLLQQENIASLQTGLEQSSIPSSERKAPHLVPSSKKTRQELNDLLESIRYASMVDN